MRIRWKMNFQQNFRNVHLIHQNCRWGKRISRIRHLCVFQWHTFDTASALFEQLSTQYKENISSPHPFILSTCVFFILYLYPFAGLSKWSLFLSPFDLIVSPFVWNSPLLARLFNLPVRTDAVLLLLLFRFPFLTVALRTELILLGAGQTVEERYGQGQWLFKGPSSRGWSLESPGGVNSTENISPFFESAGFVRPVCARVGGQTLLFSNHIFVVGTNSSGLKFCLHICRSSCKVKRGVDDFR